MKFLLAFAFLFWATSAFAQGGPGPVPSPWVQSGPTISYSNGGISLPQSVTGGGLGVGTSNVSNGYFVNSVRLSNLTEILSNKTLASPVLSGLVSGNSTIPWSVLTGTPTTLSGYGITSPSISTVDLNAGAVTYAKIQNESAHTILGNSSGTSAPVGELALLPANNFPALSGSCSNSAGSLVLNCPYSSIAGVITPQLYGALGNSNGTHGNGHDDASDIQSAIVAAQNGTIFFPCGIYRVASSIVNRSGLPVSLVFQRGCASIFSDMASPAPTFIFSPTIGTCSAAQKAACLYATGGTFLTPNAVGSGQAAFSLTNINGSDINNNTFIGQQVDVAYTLSFGPAFYDNWSFSGISSLFSADASFNSGNIQRNHIFDKTGYVFAIAPASDATVATNIENNDAEGVFGLAQFCIFGGSISHNYVESTNGAFGFPCASSSINFDGNALNEFGGTLTIQDLVNSKFQQNFFANTTVNYGSNVSGVTWENTTLSASTIPSIPLITSCTGLGSLGTCSVAGTDQSGIITLVAASGATALGQFTLTFSNPIGSNHSSCTYTPVEGTGNWTAPVSIISDSSAAALQIPQWVNGGSTALVNGNSYGLMYKCGGF